MQVDERKETVKTEDRRRKTEVWEWLAALAGFVLGVLASMKWL